MLIDQATAIRFFLVKLKKGAEHVIEGEDQKLRQKEEEGVLACFKVYMDYHLNRFFDFVQILKKRIYKINDRLSFK
jgi:hypothetical protein